MDEYTKPHLANSVLISIDTQNDFSLPGAPAYISGTEDVVPNMLRLLKLFRERAMPIVHVVRLYQRDGSNADLCRRRLIESGTSIVIPETEGAELVSALKPDHGVRLDAASLLAGNFQQIGRHEFVMYKPRWGAFYQTGLEDFLNGRGSDSLVFCGCNYPNCPRTSIYQASERDFRIVLVKDAISQLYPKAEVEMMGIGVNLTTTETLENSFKQMESVPR
jgi:nicotinamidase-related amidase